MNGTSEKRSNELIDSEKRRFFFFKVDEQKFITIENHQTKVTYTKKADYTVLEVYKKSQKVWKLKQTMWLKNPDSPLEVISKLLDQA